MIPQNKEFFVVIGFPKCGTSSLQQYFKNNNKNSIHYHYPIKKTKKWRFVGYQIKKASEDNKPLFSYLPNVDALTQLDYAQKGTLAIFPQIGLFQIMQKQYPNAKFILNVRDEQKWLKSMKGWFNLRKDYRKQNPRGADYLYGLKGTTNADYLDWYNNHINNVIDFFEDTNPHKLLVFDIEKDNINKLNKFTNLYNVTQFPHANKSKRKS